MTSVNATEGTPSFLNSDTTKDFAAKLATEVVKATVNSIFTQDTENESQVQQEEQSTGLLDNMRKIMDNRGKEEDDEKENNNQGFWTALTGTAVAIGLLYFIGKNKEE